MTGIAVVVLAWGLALALTKAWRMSAGRPAARGAVLVGGVAMVAIMVVATPAISYLLTFLLVLVVHSLI